VVVEIAPLDRSTSGGRSTRSGQVKSAYGSGQFKKDLDTACRGDDKVVTSDIQDRDGILPSIKAFLGKGR